MRMTYPASIISSMHNRMRSKFSSASFLSTLPLVEKMGEASKIVKDFQVHGDRLITPLNITHR